MKASGAPPRSLGRRFSLYAVIALLPVLVLGGVLVASYRSLARGRGIAEGRSEALVLAQTAVEPILGGRPLSDGLSAHELAALRRMDAHPVAAHDILALRLRDLSGKVVFSDDGSGFKLRPGDEALEAARGSVVARLTLLDAGSQTSGAGGTESVAVDLPLEAGAPPQRVGVLEIYLPYAPINASVAAELHTLYRDLAIGLATLYLVLIVVTSSASRGLRRQAAWNAFVAEHDTETDLPNRALFHRRAVSTLRSSRAGPTAIAVVHLDRLKDLKDVLGRENGDHLLSELARRLEVETRLGDTVSRLGGDEFGLILTNALDPERALGRLGDIISREVTVAGLPFSLAATIGYVVAPEDGEEVDELLQRAEIAMHLAKSQRRPLARYEPSQNRYDGANLKLVGELGPAMAAGELVVHYQPKSRLSDGRTVGVEALVRWNHPTLGLLYPASFLPLVDETDLIFALTSFVLDRALSDLCQLPLELSVAVNISGRSLARADFADGVIDCLERHGVPGRRLTLEVTETALLADPVRAVTLLGALDARGVRVSIDDVGSGRSSLGYLSSLPIDELKIDRSCVTDMADDPAHAAIVRSIIDLGHNLALRVVAEGVETSSVLEQLREDGCDLAQGYLLARPMPAAQLLEWLGEAQGGEASLYRTASA